MIIVSSKWDRNVKNKVLIDSIWLLDCKLIADTVSISACRISVPNLSVIMNKKKKKR